MKTRLELFMEVRRLQREGDFIKKRKLDLCLSVLGGRRREKYKGSLTVTDEELEGFLRYIERYWGITVIRPSRPNGLYTLIREEVVNKRYKRKK